jgi:F420-0:gamma-glutamyl ligase
MKVLDFLTIPPKSVMWVQSYDPLKFIKGVTQELKQHLHEHGIAVIVTDPHTEIRQLSDEYMTALGWMRIPPMPKNHEEKA